METNTNRAPGLATSPFFVLLVALASGCASGPEITVPSITPVPTGTYHYGKFIWHDLLTHDVPGVAEFYRELFGWRFESPQDDSLYATITYRGTPIGGVIYTERLDRDVPRSRWLSYLSVPDVDVAAQYVRDNGGEILAKPEDLPHRGRYAVVSDPQGAIVAFLRASGGDPVDEKLEPGEWLFTELWTTDAVAAAAFYRRLASYEHVTIDGVEGTSYHLLTHNDRPRAGVIQIPWEGVEPNWLPYVVVSDAAAVAARSEALGGKVLLPPGGIRGSNAAIIADPSGAVFSVQEWPPEDAEGGDAR